MMASNFAAGVSDCPERTGPERCDIFVALAPSGLAELCYGLPLSIRFKGYELDTLACELRRGGASVPLTRQCFELLCYLVEQRDRVVPKHELLAKLWPDTAVTENALTQTVSMVRRALGDNGRDPRFIKTYHGRGYRFVGEVLSEVSPSQVPAVQSAAPKLGSGPAPVMPRPREAMHGRAADLEQLRGALDAARAGDSRLVLLEGQAGMGKTRLAQELLHAASADGVRVLSGRCYELEGTPALWPWVQLLREYCTGCPECLDRHAPWVLAELARLLPELRERVPELPPLPSRTAEEDRFRLFDAIAQFLAEASNREPLLLFIDDMHWADSSSLQCLQLVARALGEARVMILGTHRPATADEVAAALAQLRREANADSCLLAGLGTADVARLLAGEGGVVPSGRLVEQLASLTQGNPLFVLQVARLISAHGSFKTFSNIPAEVRGVIRRRLSELPEQCLSLLRAASVFGEQVQLNHLADAAGLDADRAMQLLTPALEAGVLGDLDGRLGAYRFTHALFQETLYGDLVPAERAAWHARAGDCLERAEPASRQSRLDEIAAHYLQAARNGHAARALELAERAAARALQSTAYEQAARWCDRALEVLPLCEDIEPGRLPRLLIDKGRALSGLPERMDEAQALFRGAFEQAERQGLSALVCEAALRYAGHDAQRVMSLREAGSVDPVAVEQLETALARVGEQDLATRALLLAYLGWTLYDSRSFDRREGALDEAVSLARRIDDPETLLCVLRLRARTLSAPERLDDRIAVIDQVIGLARGNGLLETELDSRIQRSHMLIERADVAAAEAEWDAARALADELKLPSERERVERLETMRLFWQGHLEEGLARARDATERSGQSRNARQAFGIRLFMVRWVQGRSEEIIPAMEAFAQRYPLPTAWRSGLASCYASAGRVEDARREITRIAANNLDDLPRDHAYLAIILNSSTAVRALGDREIAARLLELGRPYADRIVYVGWWSFPAGALATALGVHARTAGRREEALAMFERAMEINGRIDSTLWLAATRVEYGRLLCEVGDPGRGLPILRHGLQDAETLGLGFYVDLARAPIPGLAATDGVAALN